MLNCLTLMLGVLKFRPTSSMAKQGCGLWPPAAATSARNLQQLLHPSPDTDIKGNLQSLQFPRFPGEMPEDLGAICGPGKALHHSSSFGPSDGRCRPRFLGAEEIHFSAGFVI